VKSADAHGETSATERGEVGKAIRDAHRISLRQGVMRLLDELGLSSLKKEWEEVYDARSDILHGRLSERNSTTENAQLASRATSLCGRIVLTAVAREIPNANVIVDKFYPTPTES
jgi:hypothetical protein